MTEIVTANTNYLFWVRFNCRADCYRSLKPITNHFKIKLHSIFKIPNTKKCVEINAWPFRLWVWAHNQRRLLFFKLRLQTTLALPLTRSQYPKSDSNRFDLENISKHRSNTEMKTKKKTSRRSATAPHTQSSECRAKSDAE